MGSHPVLPTSAAAADGANGGQLQPKYTFAGETESPMERCSPARAGCVWSRCLRCWSMPSPPRLCPFLAAFGNQGL